ncbi:MAG: hypothetical protein P4M08_02270 [Oligoflexia bacterium]|nr:hypothetical protein [Oligoflexia bacterium]
MSNVLWWGIATQYGVKRMAYVVFLFLMIPSMVFAAMPEQTDDSRLAPSQVSWFDGSGDNSIHVGTGASNGGSTNNTGGLNGLVVKFSKFDEIFMSVIDSAQHGSTDGYKVKYKFYF